MQQLSYFIIKSMEFHFSHIINRINYNYISHIILYLRKNVTLFLIRKNRYIFGLNDTFKKLFDEIKKSTTLSKKEISELIRYNTKCVDIIHDKPIIFTLNIEHNDILK